MLGDLVRPRVDAGHGSCPCGWRRSLGRLWPAWNSERTHGKGLRHVCVFQLRAACIAGSSIGPRTKSRESTISIASSSSASASSAAADSCGRNRCGHVPEAIACSRWAACPRRDTSASMGRAAAGRLCEAARPNTRAPTIPARAGRWLGSCGRGSSRVPSTAQAALQSDPRPWRRPQSNGDR